MKGLGRGQLEENDTRSEGRKMQRRVEETVKDNPRATLERRRL